MRSRHNVVVLVQAIAELTNVRLRVMAAIMLMATILTVNCMIEVRYLEGEINLIDGDLTQQRNHPEIFILSLETIFGAHAYKKQEEQCKFPRMCDAVGNL